MEKLNTIVYGLVSLVVIVLLVATVAIPIVEDAQNDVTTTNVNAGARFSYADNSEDLNLSILATDVSTKSYKVNGEDVTVTTTFSYRYITDKCYIALYNGEISGLTSPSIHFADGDKLEIINGAFTFTPADTEVDPTTTTITMMFGYDEDGEFGDYYYTSYNGNLKIDNDKPSYVFFNISANTPYIFAEFDKDGNSDIKAQFGHSGYLDCTLSVDLTSSAYNSYSWELESFTETLTVISTSAEYTSSSFDIIVPIEYTITDTNSNIYTLLGIIPLLLIVIPIVIVARLVTNGRD